MSSKSSPIPSKNALLALRRLAFSSTLAVGALSGVCGVAALNYETRQRVKLAERFVATKTIIRSVSNADGPARIALMCQAAERGEDYHLAVSKGHRRQRVRRHSTIAAERLIEGTEAGSARLQDILKKFDDLAQARLQESHDSREQSPSAPDTVAKHEVGGRITKQELASRYLGPPYRESNFLAVDKRRPLIHSPVGHKPSDGLVPIDTEATDRERGTRNSSTAQRILAASQRPLKQNDHRVYGRQTRGYVTSRPQLGASASPFQLDDAQPMDVDLETQPQSPPHNPHDHQSAPEQYTFNSYHQRTILEWPSPQTGSTAPLKQSEQTLSSQSSTETISDLFSDPSPTSDRSAAPRSDDTVEGSALKKVQDRPRKRSKRDYSYDRQQGADLGYYELNYRIVTNGARGVVPENEDDSHLVSSEPMATTALRQIPPPWQQSDVPALLKMATTSIAKMYGMANADGGEGEVRCLIDKAGHDHFYQTVCSIPKTADKVPVLEEISRCLDCKTPSDLSMAEILYYTFREYHQLSMSLAPIRRLTAALLNHGSPDAMRRTSYILLPHISTDRHEARLENSNRPDFRACERYLRWYTETRPYPDSWVAQTIQLVRLFSRRGINAHDEIVHVVISALVQMGQTLKAQEFLNVLRARRGMRRDIKCTSIILQSRAEAGEWETVKEIFEDLHSTNLSRTKTTIYSEMFSVTLEEYIRQKPLNEAYNYVVQAILNWGLVPRITVSRVLITACLRQGRLDIIQEWTKVVREMYRRQLSLGLGTRQSVWEVAQVWRETQPSCEMLVRQCHAMGYGNVDDTFSKAFRGVALEAVERDIRKRLHLGNEVWAQGGTPVSDESFSRMNLQDMVQFVGHFTATTEVKSLRARRILQDVVRQIKAVFTLNKIFRGDFARVDLPDQQRETQISGGKTEESNTGSPWDGAENGPLLASIQAKDHPVASLKAIVFHHYMNRWQRGQKTNHDLLEHLIPQLSQEHRDREALRMLVSMHKSHFTQGPGGAQFTHELFSWWIKIAMRLEEDVYVWKGAWAILDSEIEISVDLRILLLIATSEIVARRRPSDEHKKTYMEEQVYLDSRLRSRRWRARGSVSTKEDLKFERHHSWERLLRTPQKPFAGVVDEKAWGVLVH